MEGPGVRGSVEARKTSASTLPLAPGLSSWTLKLMVLDDEIGSMIRQGALVRERLALSFANRLFDDGFQLATDIFDKFALLLAE
jgi:hypothetical protein